MRALKILRQKEKTVFIPNTQKLSSCRALLNPFPNNKFLDCTKLKDIADDNLKLDKNDEMLSKRVENTV